MGKASPNGLSVASEDQVNRIWKCRICGCETEGTKTALCPYKRIHGYMDPMSSLSLRDLHNIEYGKPAI